MEPLGQTNAFIPDSTQWRHEVIGLDAYVGQEVIIAFQNRGRYGNQLYVDNINVVLNFNTEEMLSEMGKLYPNPATDRISFVSQNVTSTSRWMVVDGQGREVVVPMNIVEGSLEIQVKSLAAGQYFIRSLDRLRVISLPFIKK